MGLDQLEIKAIAEFVAGERELQRWDNSPLKPLAAAAPQTKGRFARSLIEALAAQGGVSFAPVPGRRGSRVRVGQASCEVKFSTQDRPQLQQIRLPDDGYDILIGIAAQPQRIVYWFIPAEDVQQLIDADAITFPPTETSGWFFPSLRGKDDFSSYRCSAARLVRKLRSLR